MTTVFHDWTYGGIVQVELGLRKEVSVSPIQAAKSLGGSFYNARNVLIPTKARSDVQTKMTDAMQFFSWCLVHYQVMKRGGS